MKTINTRLFLAAFAALMLAGAAGADETPQSRSAAGFASEHQPDELRAPYTLEAPDIPPDKTTTRQRAKVRTAPRMQCCAFYFYDAWSELYYDFDGDGHFHYLRVGFDADTEFTDAEVYAELYLSRDGGPWELYYVTDDFVLDGASAYDDYEVETELLTGYPRGYYDVLIELYDAWSQELLAEYGPYDTSALSQLPLEDKARDDLPIQPVSVSSGYGGGSAGVVFAALGLAGLAIRSRRNRPTG